jgi:hypothetical protein
MVKHVTWKVEDVKQKYCVEDFVQFSKSSESKGQTRCLEMRPEAVNNTLGKDPYI